MPLRYPAQHPASQDYDGTWSASDGGTLDQAEPTTFDDVFLTPNSGSVTLTGNGFGLTLQAGGHAQTLAIGNNVLDIAGDVSYGGTITGTGRVTCGGNLSVGASAGLTAIEWLLDGASPNIAAATAGLGSLTIDVSGTASLINVNLRLSGTLTLTAGAFDTNGKDVDAGVIVVTAGTMTVSSFVRLRGGTVANVTISSGRVIAWGCKTGTGNSGDIEFSSRQMGGISMAA